MTLKQLLNENKISMYKLAKKAGVGQSTVHEIVSGKRKRISLASAIKIADALNITVETLFDYLKGGEEINENKN
ncbi:MAG: helix-turn-helix transcriptional regulator [Caloramator sp.]|nr:helix-turn-helix transcriptional regulator [Caloramator sp.]